MELYPSGLVPEGYPTAGLPPTWLPQAVDAAPAGASLVVDYLPKAPLQVPLAETQAAMSSIAEASPEEDLEFLERLLRECHIDGAIGAPTHPSGGPPCPAVAPDARHDAALMQVALWADEMVRQLQGCASADEARPKCAEMLVAFHQLNGGGAEYSADRVRTLQGANSALLRGFRNMYHRHRELAAQHKRAEEAFVNLASELAKSQEALRASERAKSTLQYHLQFMSAGPTTAAGGM